MAYERLGGEYEKVKKFDKALSDYRHGALIYERYPGGNGKNDALHSFCSLCKRMHKVGEAERLFHEIYTIRALVDGAKSNSVIALDGDISYFYAEQGNYRQACYYSKQALALAEQIHGVNWRGSCLRRQSISIGNVAKSRKRENSMLKTRYWRGFAC